ncbi:MAG: hypothetical protein HY892_03090 [Deltaproteobacteria bacterium]|nr:hypothetical protein [Deltaproteobacteria bacterium]
MLKKTGFRLLGLAVMISILFVVNAWTEEQGWEKTTALPDGEVVCDLNGEWNFETNWRGVYKRRNFPSEDVLKIIQQGNSFQGIRMVGNKFFKKDEVVIEGEIDKNGFKQLILKLEGPGGGAQKGKLSKDGNKIEIDTVYYFIELKRK